VGAPNTKPYRTLTEESVKFEDPLSEISHPLLFWISSSGSQTVKLEEVETEYFFHVD